MHFQLLSEEGLFIEVVAPDEDEGCAVPKAFRGCAVTYLAKHTVCSIHLSTNTSSKCVFLVCSQGNAPAYC